jgi:serine/threonine protein kinase
LGIILYDMVCGEFPFDSDSAVMTHHDKEVVFTRSGLSDDFTDLVKQCLAFYVADRITIEKIIDHKWMQG